MAVIIGIDPAIRGDAGWAIIDTDGKYVASGTWSFNAKEPLGKRLERLFDYCLELLKHWRPIAIAVEIPPGKVSHRPQRADVPLILGQAVGMIRGAAACWGLSLPIEVYSSQAKAAAGHGHMKKEQVQQAMQERFELDELPGLDEGMAIAIALSGLEKLNEQKQNTETGVTE